MELKVLGPLDLIAGGQRIQIGGHRQRVVLALLGLNANRVLSVDQLAEAVWGSATPVTARAQVQTCVSALRRLLIEAGRPAAIETRDPGYLLHLPHEHLDLTCFERLLAEAASRTRDGELEEGLAKLCAALRMWRGEPLADLDSEVIRRHAVNLVERHRAAQLERTRLEIELGSHAEAVARLQEMTARDPLSEEPHRLLMLALHRSGRQAEALEAYRRARNLFVDHLGIEPSQRLVDLEHTILNDECGSAPVSTPSRQVPAVGTGVPRLLPADIADFVGRHCELALITERLQADSTGFALPVVSVSGPAGVGKTTLAIHAGHALASRFPDGQLYASLRDGDPDEVRAHLLYSLGIGEGTLPDDRQLRAGLLRSRLAGRRILLILDDALDEEQVSELLPGSASCAVLVTSRHRLAGLAGARRIDLPAFDDGEAREFLRCVLGARRVAAEDEATQRIVDSCDRLPLALRIAAARLVARPQWSLAELATRLGDGADPLREFAHGVLDVSVSIDGSQRRLAPRSALLFRLLTLVERPTCPVWAAAALLDAHLDEARDLLDDLADAQLLQPTGAGQFLIPRLVRLHAQRLLLAEVHPVVRHAALGRLHQAALALADHAHRSIFGCDHVVARGSASQTYLPEAIPPVVSTDPLAWLAADGPALLDYLQSAGKHGNDRQCWELAVVLASLFTHSRQFEAGRTAIAVGRSAARRARDSLGLAAIDYACGVIALTRGDLQLAETALQAAVAGFDAVGDQHGQALSLTELAALDCVRSESSAALAKCAIAAAALERSGCPERGADKAAVVTLLCITAHGLTGLGKISAATARLDEAFALCREIGYRRGEARILHQKGLVSLVAGELDQAADYLDRALRIAAQQGDPLIEGIIHAAWGRHACASRTWHLATAHLATAAALFESVGCGLRTAQLEPVVMAALAGGWAELTPL